LSVVTVQANAAQRVLDQDPETARAALVAIAESSRRALDDLDHVLALLREEPAPGHPQWTLADLDLLLTDLRGAGLTVDVYCSGDLTTVPAVASREAYRILQEGLTNALRHAGPVPVTLAIHCDGSGLALELSNPMGADPAPNGGQPSGGRGLTGISERVALLGGTMSAGEQGGQWRMAVHLP
jgi:signal transduction histidine kinase